MRPVVAVPVKRFFVAKRRLGPVLGPEARSRLGQALALHTLETIALAADAAPVVLASDDEVTKFASDHGYVSVPDAGTGLNDAVTAFAEQCQSEARPWLVLHADLPLVRPDDVAALLDELSDSTAVLAPSNDGGTSAVGADRPVRTSFGPGSFHKHLASVADAVVISRLGLALDLDDQSDLAAAIGHPRGKWLSEYAGPA